MCKFALLRKRGLIRKLSTCQNLTNEALTRTHEGSIGFCDFKNIAKSEARGAIQMLRTHPGRAVGRNYCSQSKRMQYLLSRGNYVHNFYL